jgi:hypothetical protein
VTENTYFSCVLDKNLQRMDTASNKEERKVCILYNQRDATYTIFFIIISVLHVSGGFSSHHQELIKLYVQPWELSCFLLSKFQPIHTNSRQQESMTIPKAAHTVL